MAIKEAKDLRKYDSAWADLMVEIWREQIAKLGITDTGAVAREIQTAKTITEEATMIRHRMLQYGVYAAQGVGKGFKGNPGDLPFMSAGYRAANGYGRKQVGYQAAKGRMNSPKFERKKITRGKNAGKDTALTSGNPRVKRDWIFKKYYYSVHRMARTHAMYQASEFAGIIVKTLKEDVEAALQSGINSI